MVSIDETIEKLDGEVRPVRNDMKPSKEMLYSNEETGTVVYRVLTDNTTLPYPITERIVWGHFLIGNSEGYFESNSYVHSEANFHIGKIHEDENKIVIPRHGYETVHWGLQMEVSDLEFKKSEFVPYGQRET